MKFVTYPGDVQTAIYRIVKAGFDSSYHVVKGPVKPLKMANPVLKVWCLPSEVDHETLNDHTRNGDDGLEAFIVRCVLYYDLDNNSVVPYSITGPILKTLSELFEGQRDEVQILDGNQWVLSEEASSGDDELVVLNTLGLRTRQPILLKRIDGSDPIQLKVADGFTDDTIPLTSDLADDYEPGSLVYGLAKINSLQVVNRWDPMVDESARGECFGGIDILIEISHEH